MKTHISIIAVALILAIASSSAHAVTTKYWDTGTGNWNVSGNWNPSSIPNSSNEVKIRYTNANCTIPNGYTASCYRLYVYHSSTATLNIADGATLVTDNNFFKTGFDNTQHGRTLQTGDVNLGTGDLFVGDGSSSYDTDTAGKYYQYGGTLTAQDCWLAYRTGDGWIFQSGGLADYSGNMRVGYNHSVGRGRYELTGGTLDIAGYANLGETAGCTGIFIMSGGSLGINGTLYVGGAGYGTMTVSGGDVDVAAVSVTDILDVDKGADWDAVGNMAIGASSTVQVDVTGADAADHTQLDVDGDVTLTSGCTLEMYVGDYAPASGTEITIIKVPGDHSITGTFTNVPEGWSTVLKENDTELAVHCGEGGGPGPVPAFPGAEGEGKWATGGRGGDVYHVTNLNDSGAGSLRYGIDNSGEARTIVFDTGGTIHLTSGGLFINSDRITIAGQTAPGDGICIIGHGLALDDADDIIIRHIRVRPGDIEEGAFSGDAIGFRICDDIIFDHVSASWGIDEVLSPTKCPSDCTIQWCIISEGLNCTPYHDKDPCHSCGTLCRAQYRDCYITFHHNIWAHNQERNPRLGSYDDVTLYCDFRYNLIYNYGTSIPGSGCVQSVTDGERCNLNYVGNYIVEGPDSDGGTYAFKGWDANYMDIYQSGNKIDGDRDNNKDGSDTGWSMFDGDYDDKGSPFDMEAVSADTADNAADDVRDYAGATLPSRDSVDARVVADIWDDDGDIIDSQDDVGGYPAYATGSAPTDTDQDGMPDTWEDANGTNKNVADNNGDLDEDGYTNLEEYLNDLCD